MRYGGPSARRPCSRWFCWWFGSFKALDSAASYLRRASTRCLCPKCLFRSLPRSCSRCSTVTLRRRRHMSEFPNFLSFQEIINTFIVIFTSQKRNDANAANNTAITCVARRSSPKLVRLPGFAQGSTQNAPIRGRMRHDRVWHFLRLNTFLEYVRFE